MSRLNKRALYQMATKDTGSATPVAAVSRTLSQPVHNSTSANLEFTFESVQLKPVTSFEAIPDGRVSGKLTAPVLTKVEVDDGSSVSARARRKSAEKLDGFKRNEVLQKLGSGSLGLLTNAYLEQQIMYDEELHCLQQRFYGLQAV